MVGPYFFDISFLIFLAKDVLPDPERPVIQNKIPFFFINFHFFSIKFFLYHYDLNQLDYFLIFEY